MCHVELPHFEFPTLTSQVFIVQILTRSARTQQRAV